eukprot:gb/GECG01016837.1/.p1 GENE.gb/GECG01016837.1/~~gb/GECG01016837.1/.p1  ORF type:complete len:222 (+),score=43.75 gb/GECG01016837.1/:1-666(+)
MSEVEEQKQLGHMEEGESLHAECFGSSYSTTMDDNMLRISREDLDDDKENTSPSYSSSSLELSGNEHEYGQERDAVKPPSTHKADVDDSRYEKIPDTVAALQDSHRALLSQLRETQEMLELVLDENDKLRGQLCASQTALRSSQRMYEHDNTSSVLPRDTNSHRQSSQEDYHRTYSVLKDTTNAMSAIAQIHRRETKSTRLQRNTLKQVLQSQDLEHIVSL